MSPGQRLALDQLFDIAAKSSGALEIVGEPEDKNTHLLVRLSLATAGYRTDAGFQFRERERLLLYLFPDFPFTLPWLYFDHGRFIGKPHVQWGRYICLYQSSEAEYQPADGLFGFFERIDVWMTAAGSGQLDPEDAPLHPPVAYASSDTRLVIKADCPPDNPAEAFWIGRADLTKIRDARFDVVGWTSLDQWAGEPAHPIAGAILLKQPLASEYPSKVRDLIDLTENAGLPFSLLLRFLRLFALYRPHGEAGRFILGAPMRRKAEGERLKQHLTVWEVAAEPLDALRTYFVGATGDDAEAARAEVIRWMAFSDVTWCPVLEDRPEIVHRRDGGALAADLAGKRVLLFGAGALGSAVAETAVRVGASHLCIVDRATVKPGILVRQRYADADIGCGKASILKKHLDALGLPCAITHERRDLSGGALSVFDLADFDLVVDATASVKIHHRLERELAEQPLAIPMLSMAVGAAASHGSVAVKMPGYHGGPLRIARQAKLAAFARDANHSAVKAFWPAREDIKPFQPEPGCSEPTFVGSAADIDHHASGLLNIGLSRVRTLEPAQASMDLTSAPWLAVDSRERARLSYAFTGNAERVEQRYGYKVLRSAVAQKGMAAELRRIARTHSDKIETGGLLFGEIDDAHGLIWIDSVSGPPSDSKASAAQFLCGTAGTKELADFRSKASGASSRFIGIWHTHPVSRGRPSNDDLQAMVQLLHMQEATPRQVVMLILGHAATKASENYYIFRRNEFTLIGQENAVQGEGA